MSRIVGDRIEPASRLEGYRVSEPFPSAWAECVVIDRVVATAHWDDCERMLAHWAERGYKPLSIAHYVGKDAHHGMKFVEVVFERRHVENVKPDDKQVRV